MENIKEFANELSSEIMRMLPDDVTKDMTIEHAEVTKMNDQILYGLSFRREGESAAPTVYVNEAFEDHMNGKPIELISGELVQVYLDSVASRTDLIPQELDFGNIKDGLTIRLVEIKRNRQFLSGVPYMPVGNGLAAVCDVKIREDEEGYWRTTLNREFVASWNFDVNELFAIAMENAPNVDPPRLLTIKDQIFGGPGMNYLETGRIGEEDKAPMYVLSNKSSMLGAAALFYPGVQERIADNLGEGYYALPSSVHEFLIVPKSLAPDPKELSDMVVGVNRSMVDPKDVLSDNILIYDKEEKRLTKAMPDAERSERHGEARC